MKRQLVFLSMFFTALSGLAQEDYSHPVSWPHVTLSNGTVVSSTYDEDNNSINVQVDNNTTSVEVVVEKDGVEIDSETTTQQSGQVNLNISGYGNGDYNVIIRTDEEEQTVGSVHVASGK